MKIPQSSGDRCGAISARSSAFASITTILVGVVVLASLPKLAAYGQEKYNPDHPVVRTMADSAAASLGRGNNIGESTLAALAIVEHSKRYLGVIPKDHPAVSGTINQIVGMFPTDGSSGGEILSAGEVYFPALALILLAEVDDKKYSSEINRLLKMFEERQRPNGTFTYLNQPNTSDTSQTQFAALAFSVAKSHKFNVDIPMATKALNWLCDSQQNGGSWVYKFGPNGRPLTSSTPTLSIQAAGASSVYLLADFLQLYRRSKDMSRNGKRNEEGLPRTVGIYIKPPDGNEVVVKEGPLTQFDRGKLDGVLARGNASFENRFRPNINDWTFYYLYAVERYAYFREQTEGDMGTGPLSTWYDQGVDFLKSKQQARGGFSSTRESQPVATALALLFLVRSSEIINFPPRDGNIHGNKGFPKDEVLKTGKLGMVQGLSAERNLEELIEMLQGSENVPRAQLAELSRSLKQQIVEFRNKDDKSRGEIKQFLRSMIGAREYFRRLVAVRFLAGEQDMDNVPALLYALGDPDLRICLEAHDGLRLISRKLDSITISESARTNAGRDPAVFKKDPELESRVRAEFVAAKKTWTDWFLRIRPGAELLD